jgi:hypothetical protein
MTEPTSPTTWHRDAVDPQWYCNPRGAVRGPGYRPGGWWFLPAYQPDEQAYDVGPFRTMRAAIKAADNADRPEDHAGRDGGC